MAARAAFDRSAIDASLALEERAAATVLDFARPPYEAMDDLDWLVNESSSDMGESSAFGAMLERASRERELVVEDDSYMHGKRPGVYGKSLSDKPWQELVPDPSIRRNSKKTPKHIVDGGYHREIWGRRHKTTPVTPAYEMGQQNIDATEMVRNFGELLELLPKATRRLLLTRHTQKVQSVPTSAVFGEYARVAHLSSAAVKAWTEDRGTKASLAAWLDALAARVHDRKPRAGETSLVAAIRKEMKSELALAYELFTKAQKRLPRYFWPHHDRKRADRRRSLVGT